MLTKESVEKKWSDYAQTAQQDKKASALPTLLKTTGVLAGVALVPCLSASMAQGAVIAGTGFGAQSTVGTGPTSQVVDLFGGKASLSVYVNGSVPYLWLESAGLNTGIFVSGSNLRQFANGSLIGGLSTDTRTGGDFARDATTYFGVIFTDDLDDDHIGWVEVEVDMNDSDSYIKFIAWGYETDADTPISAGAIPEPSSLALLACGAAGLVAKRRKKKASA
jgi:hypothetical protein